MSKKKQPYFKFWVDNWRSDPQLRKCSYAARGLWIELLCLMHENEPYGHLGLTPGVNPSSQIARLTGGAYQTVSALLTELATAGVYSTTTGGVMFSRKMVRDYEKSIKGQEVGKAGGNPALQKGLTHGLTTEVKPQSPESIIKKEDAPGGSAPMAPPTGAGNLEPSPPVAPPPSPVVQLYALDLGHGMRLTHEDLGMWQKLYANIDVVSELMSMRNWLKTVRDKEGENWFHVAERALNKRSRNARIDREVKIELESKPKPKSRHPEDFFDFEAEDAEHERRMKEVMKS